MMKRTFTSYWPLTTHKSIEFQFQLFGSLASWLEFAVSHQSKCDHAGIYFSFSLFKLFFLEINFADNRHWNHEKNRWALDNEDVGAYIDEQAGCRYNSLSAEFDWETAHDMWVDVRELRKLTQYIFPNFAGKNKKADQFADEIGCSIREFDEWFESILGKQD